MPINACNALSFTVQRTRHLWQVTKSPNCLLLAWLGWLLHGAPIIQTSTLRSWHAAHSLYVHVWQGAQAAAAGAAANGPGSSKQVMPGVFMSPPFIPSMMDPIVAAFSPHRAQQQK